MRTPAHLDSSDVHNDTRHRNRALATVRILDSNYCMSVIVGCPFIFGLTKVNFESTTVLVDDRRDSDLYSLSRVLELADTNDL